MRRRFAAALTAALLVLSACELPAQPDASQTPENPVQTPAQSEEPAPSQAQAQPQPFALAWEPGDTLNPLQARNPNQTLVPLVFEGLFTLNASFAVENVLCQSYTQSEDSRSWTFFLRSDVTFSDGTPLTADVVAACLNEARTSQLYGARLAGVQRISAEEGSVTVALSAPNGALPALLDLPIFLYQTREEGELPLGTGRYRFDNTTGALRLTASPTWRGSGPLPADVILLHQTSSVDARISAFDTGLVTLVDTDFTSSAALGYSGSYESWDYPTTAMLYLGFNTKRGACQDAALRQAVSCVVDRANLVVSLLAGHADSCVLPVSPWSELYDAALAAETGYSPSDAAQILTDGGYVLDEEGVLTLRGRVVPLTLVVNSESIARTELAGELAEELGKLGLAVTVSKLNWDDYISALARGNFDLYLGQVKLTADFDLTELLEGGLNYGGYSDQDVSALLAEFRAAGGDARRTAASALYARLAVELPFLPLCFTRGTILTQWGAASGLTPTSNDPFYGMENWKLS